MSLTLGQDLKVLKQTLQEDLQPHYNLTAEYFKGICRMKPQVT